MIALQNILVATDFGDASNAALLYGRTLARAHGATLHVLHIVGDVASEVASPVGLASGTGPLQADLEADAQQRLDEMLSDADRRDLRARTLALTSSTPTQAILAYAHDERIDLIVVGTHGRTGISHFFMGSIAENVVRLAPCPVLTVRHPEREFVLPDALQQLAVAR